MANDNTLLWVGGAAAAVYFLFIKPAQTGQPSPLANVLQPITSAGATLAQNTATVPPNAVTTQPGTAGQVTAYPYLVNGAPLPLPPIFDQGYYETYVYPAMLQMDGNVGSHDYVFTIAEGQQYLANYVDIQQWIQSFKSGTQQSHLVYHWQTYGVAESRTFLPLWSINPSEWVPPPPNPKSSGVFSDVLKAVTVVGAGAAIVASGGTLTAVVAPAAGLALTAESSIHGTQPQLGDNELQILFTGAAIIIDILPFYNQVDKKSVKAITATLHSLLTQYA